ncbi:hypothetical protein HNR26_003804 [Rhizobium rosettiformans]|uniref:Uncharacterized protein n=2 Tax=Rhizobium rosettiformans TaxID=1368430 RepID=A0A4S8PXV7_9HYPH|nr:hypothetical protein [Rhizobium rosettiformans]MBB5277723.1 hypothetical protein [Rhizobium rosettiformans]THV33069.1 hypothetical protein FAA86_17910 [Rhizobium rosettiformans W3]
MVSIKPAESNVVELPRADLENRIADAFTSTLSSAQIAALLREVDQADQAAQDASIRANEIALDPTTRPDAVAKARKEMEDADFTRRRMERATERLTELHDQAVKRERSEANRQEYDAARAERDQLVEDLKEYPDLIDRVTALILRVRDNDARLERVNSLAAGDQAWLASAEYVASGSPSGWNAAGSSDRPRLMSSKLVELTDTGTRPINLKS